MYRIIFRVRSAHPSCAAGYQVGEKIVIERDMIQLDQTDRLCPYALSALIPYIPLLGHETAPTDWIHRKEEIQCPDSRTPVLFEVLRERLTPPVSGDCSPCPPNE
jgi:uncharacterized repeat protein (TIGR04076 family)